MTEAEWLVWADSESMLKFIQTRTSERKLRLFAVACCRGIWDSLDNEQSRRSVVIAEAFADGLVSDREREAAHQAAQPQYPNPVPGLNTPPAMAAAETTVHRTPISPGGTSVDIGFPREYAYMTFCEVVLFLVRHTRWESNYLDRNDLARQVTDKEEWCRLIRDIFGNPFRPVTFSPEWRTDTALALARQMYESRDFSAMPILADALQDAGCDSEDILNHCRDRKQTYVRGCWVVDLVLAKE